MNKRKYQEFIQEYDNKIVTLKKINVSIKTLEKQRNEIDDSIDQLRPIRKCYSVYLNGLELLLPYLVIDDIVLIIINYCISEIIEIAYSLKSDPFGIEYMIFQNIWENYNGLQNIFILKPELPIYLYKIESVYYQSYLFTKQIQEKQILIKQKYFITKRTDLKELDLNNCSFTIVQCEQLYDDKILYFIWNRNLMD